MPTSSRRLATNGDTHGDDDVDNDSDDNVDNNGGDDIINNDDDRVVDNIDGTDDIIDEDSGPNVDNLNDFGNQLEELEDQDIEDDSTSPSCGDKRRHSRAGPAHQWREPVKVQATTGAKPRASDYEVAVRKVLHEAIPLYRGYLSTVTPFPGPMDEIRWAKKSWSNGCEECDILMASNDEIIKLVRVSWTQLPTNAPHSPFLKITARSSHFRGRIKTKVQPLVKAMYGFIANSKEKEYNKALAGELKDGYNFIYAVGCLSFFAYIY